MYECPNRNFMCPALYCKFINKLETVINHSIKCPFHLIYCAECKALSRLCFETWLQSYSSSANYSFDIKYIITKIYHSITCMEMSYSKDILSMNPSKIIITIDIIYLFRFHTVYHHLLIYSFKAFFKAEIKFDIITLGRLYFQLHLYFLNDFVNSK